MKKILIAAIVVATAFTACKKTISSKRLDGTWKLTSGTGTSKTDASQTNGSTTTSYTTNSTLTMDGAKLTTVTTSNIAGSTTTTTTGVFTSEFTFTKSDDKFVSRTKSDWSNDNNWTDYYASEADCNTFTEDDAIFQRTTYSTDATSNGLFTVLGSTGEIEKNSRILTETNSSSSTTTTVIAYMKGTAVVATPYMRSSTFTCVLAPTSAPSTSQTDSDVDDSGTIITVKESTKSEMTITSKTVNTQFGQGTDKTVTSTESTLKYTKN